MARWLDRVFGREEVSIPTGSITRLEAAVLVARAFHMINDDIDVLLQFPDYYLVPEVYRPYLAALVTAGIMRGHGAGRMAGHLDPLGTLTTGQATALIAQSAGIIYHEAGAFNGDIFVNGVINTGGVVLNDAHTSGNLIITGQGETIYINGDFAHVIIDTTTSVVINGFVERLTILAEGAVVEIVDGVVGKIYVWQDSRVFGTGEIGEIVYRNDGVGFELEINVSPTPTVTPTPRPTATPIPAATQTPVPEYIPTPVPTAAPIATPAPTQPPTPTPVPVPPTRGPIIDDGLTRSFVITLPDGSTITITDSEAMFDLLNRLDSSDEIIIDGGNIVGAIIDRPSANFNGAGLINPNPPFELQISDNTNLTISSIASNLHGLIIVGDKGSTVTISENRDGGGVSLRGNHELYISSSEDHTFTLKLMDNATVEFPSNQDTILLRLNSSMLSKADATVTIMGVSIHVEHGTNYAILLDNTFPGGLRIRFVESASTNQLIPFTIICPQNTAISLRLGRVVLLRGNGIGFMNYTPNRRNIDIYIVESDVTLGDGSFYNHVIPYI